MNKILNFKKYEAETIARINEKAQKEKFMLYFLI